MQEQVVAVVEFFGLTDEDIYLAVINRKEDIKLLLSAKDVNSLPTC